MLMMRNVNFFLHILFLSFGVLFFLIASHELYHYIALDGKATGICFGRCKVEGGFSAAAVYWEISESNSKNESEETFAWIFSFFVSAVLILLFLITELKKPN